MSTRRDVLSRIRSHAQRHRLLAVVEDATLAASIHNSQPWRFVIAPGRIEVWLDLADRPTIVDADGRWALQSLGAAVANVELAVRCRMELPAEVDVLPGPAGRPPAHTDGVPPGLAGLAAAPVAVVALGSTSRPPTATETWLHAAIPTRRTSRRPAPGKVDDDTVSAVVEVVEGPDRAREVEAVLPDAEQSAALLALTAEVERDWRNDVAYLAEVERWAERGDGLGIPAGALGPRDSEGNVPGRDFAVGVSGARPAPAAEPFERAPRLLVIRTAADGYADWLRAGIALERAMLAATAAGVDVGVLGQLVERDGTRERAQALLGGGPATVQQVLRLGRSAPGTGPPTPRKPLGAVVTWQD